MSAAAPELTSWVGALAHDGLEKVWRLALEAAPDEGHVALAAVASVADVFLIVNVLLFGIPGTGSCFAGRHVRRRGKS